jgi:CheY-like chemotaxis protein
MEPKTVLVADDDPATLVAYGELLEECGYRVIEARNGGEAILLVRQFLPDLILMDVVMPVVGGLEAAASLREYPHTASIPIIGVTGAARPGEQERMPRVCDDLLLKPCPPAAILDRVRELTA